MDIEGRDMYGHTISHYSARDKWHPLPESSKKQTICGKLHNFDYNEGDQDWEFNIIPSGPYADMLYRAKTTPRWPPTIAVCDGGKCVHAEINPDGDFPTNDLFKIDWDNPEISASPLRVNFPATSAVEGKEICVYGPWIRDSGHSNKPEIHPAELTWWRETPSTSTTRLSIGRTNRQSYHVMMIQDDREKGFEREDYYNYPCTISSDFDDVIDLINAAVSALDECLNPPPFRPWSKYPRRSRVRLAFELNATGAPLRSYAISERHAHHVITSGDAEVAKDQGPGSEYQLSFDGRTILTVRELSNDSRLGVVFSDVCFDAATNTVRGFININSKYGEGDRGGEGYHVLDISQADVWLRPGVLTKAAVAVVDSEHLRFLSTIRSLRGIKPRPPAMFIGPPRRLNSVLVADIGMSLADEANRKMDVSTLRFVNGDREVRLSTDTIRLADSSAALRLVRDVPIAEQTLLRIEHDNGDVNWVPRPHLGIGTGRRETRSVGGSTITNWNGLLRAFRIQTNITSFPGNLMHSSEWRTRVTPRYFQLDDRGLPEDETLLSSILSAAANSATRGTQAVQLQILFGTATPFRVQWGFRAINETTRRAVQVAVGPGARAGHVQVDTTSERGIPGFRVQFPRSADSLYRVEARATVTDSYGHSGVMNHVIWSHYVSMPNRNRSAQLLSWIGTIVGTDPVQLSADTMIASGGNRRNAATRQRMAESLVGMIREAATDGVITPDELDRLLREAQSLRAIRS